MSSGDVDPGSGETSPKETQENEEEQMAEKVVVLVGTKKGLFVAESGAETRDRADKHRDIPPESRWLRDEKTRGKLRDSTRP